MPDPYHVLIVEDVYGFASVLQRLIKRRYPNALVDSVATTEMARSIYARSELDLIIANYGLPDVTGLDLIHFVRAHGDDLPIIAISTYEADCEMYMAVGATTFLSGLDVVKEILPFLSFFLPYELVRS